MHELRRQTQVSAPVEDVFNFFSDAANLDRITPAWLDFRILTPQPIVMELNTIFDLSLKLCGMRFRWSSQITLWDPPHVFVDEQTKGPYSYWHHTHRFSETEAGTIKEDLVRYAVPGWLMEPSIHSKFVRPRLEKIFDFREKKLKQIFSNP